MPLPSKYQDTIERVTRQLTSLLGENLYSCVLYGSTVRGDVVENVSDINILIVLNHSTPEAHTAIADCLECDIYIDPFVITRKGMERSFDVFAIKFRSIKRNYKVLAGQDPISDFSVSDDRIRFLAEQAIRNLRLRSVNNYIHQRKNIKRYTRFLLNTYTAMFTYVGEILRLSHKDVPNHYEQRIPLIEDYFKINASVLHTLVKIQSSPDTVSLKSIPSLHSELFTFLNGIVLWMEENW